MAPAGVDHQSMPRHWDLASARAWLFVALRLRTAPGATRFCPRVDCPACGVPAREPSWPAHRMRG